LNELFPNFRDPLFGIIIIAISIFAISFLTYTFGLYREKKTRKEYRKLLKRFEIGKLKDDDFVHLYTTYNLPFDSILLLASSFLHKGNYTKAISVYLTLLEVVKDNVKKEELLELLGTSYFKGGFLQRSKDIYLKILKFSPRNKNALNYLLLIYEKLKEYDNAMDIIEVLDELDVDIKQDKVYIQTLILLEDPIISFEKKSDLLLELLDENRFIQRLVAQFLIKYNKPILWQNIDKLDITNNLDLFWYLDFNDIDFDVVMKYDLLVQIYCAKGYIKENIKSDIFELMVLISTKHSTYEVDADLNFEFICSKCKKTHPIFETRCPHCHSILTFKVNPKLAKQTLNISSFL